MTDKHPKRRRGAPRPARARSRKDKRSSKADLRMRVKCFLASYLPQHRGASPHTIAAYGYALKRLLAFLSRRGKKRKEPTFRDITAENMLAFLTQLEKKRGNGPSTRNVRLAAIHSFLHFAFLMGCLEDNQYERLKHIAFKRTHRRVVSYLEVAELKAIYRAVDYRTRDGFRDLVILKLLYNTGARASEIATIRISDLSLGDLRVTVTGKGGKERVCGLWETTVALLRVYLASERRTPRKGFEDYLFISQRRKPFTRFGVYDIVRRYARKAADACPSLPKKTVTPHTIRHTTAVHLLAAGADFNTVRDWLGHAHISTTEEYAHVDLRTKRQALRKLQQLDRELFGKIAVDHGMPKVDPAIRRWLDWLSD
jgi:integrase/recombinase XerD